MFSVELKEDRFLHADRWALKQAMIPAFVIATPSVDVFKSKLEACLIEGYPGVI